MKVLAKKPSLVTLDEYGLATALHDDAFPLTELGPVSILQSSTVDWNEETQAFEVTFIRGKLKGFKLCEHLQLVARKQAAKTEFFDYRAIAFPTYTEAVNAEIEVIEGLRNQGLDWI